MSYLELPTYSVHTSYTQDHGHDVGMGGAAGLGHVCIYTYIDIYYLGSGMGRPPGFGGPGPYLVHKNIVDF